MESEGRIIGPPTRFRHRFVEAPARSPPLLFNLFFFFWLSMILKFLVLVLYCFCFISVSKVFFLIYYRKIFGCFHIWSVEYPFRCLDSDLFFWFFYTQIQFFLFWGFWCCSSSLRSWLLSLNMALNILILFFLEVLTF